jgi:hypothetical protein
VPLFKNEVLRDNFSTAGKTEFLAKDTLQPFISARIWPWRTEHAQYLTELLPLPNRTPRGFFVIAVLGKILIQILACFFNLRRKKRRKDSNCLPVSRPGSLATTQKSPIAKVSGCL